MSTTKLLRDAERYAADNSASARLILRDPEKYGGEDSLIVRWARRILEAADEQSN